MLKYGDTVLSVMSWELPRFWYMMYLPVQGVAPARLLQSP